MYLLNGGQFLNITPLSLSSVCFATLPAPAPVIVIVPLTSIYASLEIHKLDLGTEVLSLIWLSALYVSCESSFTSTHFLS